MLSEERELSRALHAIADPAVVTPRRWRPRPRLTGKVAAGALVVTILVLAVGIGRGVAEIRQGRNGSAAATAGPALSAPSPAPTTPPRSPEALAFPDLPIVLGSVSGEIFRIHADGSASPPIRVCPGRRVIALYAAPSGTSVLAVCSVDAATAEGFVIDVSQPTTLTRLPLSLMPRDDVAAWSPDGRSIAVLTARAPGDRPRIVLFDLGSRQFRTVLDDAEAMSNVLWTAIGLTAHKRQPPDDGARVWDGRSSWDRFSAHIVIASDASGRTLLLEPRGMGSGGVLLLRLAGREVRLSPADAVETAIGLGPAGEAIAWRIRGSGGAIVVYENAVQVREAESQLICGSAEVRGEWAVCDPTLDRIQAYSVRANGFAIWPGSAPAPLSAMTVLHGR